MEGQLRRFINHCLHPEVGIFYADYMLIMCPGNGRCGRGGETKRRQKHGGGRGRRRCRILHSTRGKESGLLRPQTEEADRTQSIESVSKRIADAPLKGAQFQNLNARS